MIYNVKVTPTQLARLAAWAEYTGAGARESATRPADVLLRAEQNGDVVAGQGDARVLIHPDGTTEEEYL